MTSIEDIRVPDCTACKLHKTAKVVCEIGFGPPRTDIMVVSKMSNSQDWQVDLEFELEQLGFDPRDIYYANAIKCRTFDQDASNLDVKTCRTYLDQELAVVKPKFVLTLGNEALLSVTGKSGITKYRGRVYEDARGFDVIPTVSPSAVRRNPGQRPGYLADLRLFANRVNDRPSGIPAPKYTIVDTKKKLKKLKNALSITHELSFDVETTGEYYKSDGYMISLSGTGIIKTSSGEKRYVFALPLYHPESPWQNQHRSVINYLKEAFESIPKVVAWNGSYDVKWMIQYGVNINFTFDPMLAVHVLNENVLKGLKPQAMARLGVEPWGIDTSNLLSKRLKDILHYNVLDTWYMYHIKLQLVEELKSQPRVARLFKFIMMDGSNDLLRSEMRGIWTDVPLLAERTPIMQEKLEDIERRILRAAKLADKQGRLRVPNGECSKKPVDEWPIQKVLKTRGPVYAQPNFNASNFARWMLFDHLGLPVISRGKDKPDGRPGDPSMAEDVMLELKGQHPVIDLMLERVSYQKTLSSFFIPYAQLYDDNHRIHTNFKLAGTVTGRLSSGKNDADKISATRGSKLRGVNLQQVPRDPFVRGVFGAPPGWSFVEADYSQIELRLVAFVSRDPTMLHLYSIGADIHRATAGDVLGIPLDQVSSEDRKKAKAVNFGFVYGMGWRKFIETAFLKYGATFTEQQAQEVRRAFFEHFNYLPRWHQRQRMLVNKYGRVQSPIGRVRHLPDIYSPEQGVRAEAERQAINSPIQAMGSDMAVVSMVEINRQFRSNNIRGHCLGLVHDAINFEIKNEDVPRALPIIKNTMEDASLIYRKFETHLDVPIVADVKLGQHWGGAIEMPAEQVLSFSWDDWNREHAA